MENKLFIDTCVNQLSIVIKQDDKISYQKVFTDKNKVAEVLIKEIQNGANSCNIQFKEFNKLYITKGPGSYTGERLGLTFAKTYALLNKGVQVNIISTLKAISLNELDKTYICLLDARNNACFCGIYKNGILLKEDARLEKEEIDNLINEYKDATLVTILSQQDVLSSRFNKKVIGVDIGLNMANNETLFDFDQDPMTIKPVYLRGKNEY